MMLWLRFVDGFIVALVLLLIGLIVYRWIKNKDSLGCAACTIHKRTKRQTIGLKEYYFKQKAKERN